MVEELEKDDPDLEQYEQVASDIFTEAVDNFEKAGVPPEILPALFAVYAARISAEIYGPQGAIEFLDAMKKDIEDNIANTIQ